jgi:hypothetical protein
MDNDPRSIQPPIRYSRGDRLHPCRNRDAEILLHRELRPARATRISRPNSIGTSTGLGKLRARIKLGYGQWSMTSDDSTAVRAEVSHVLLNLAVARSSPRVDLAFVATRGSRTALTLEGMAIARGFAQYLVGPVHVSNHPAQHTLHELG